MPKITNKQPGPASVYVGGVSMAVAPGEFIESDDFLESELKFYIGFPESFEVTGKAQTNDDPARKALQDIADLFGTPDIDYLNVKAAVARLIEDHNARMTAADVNNGDGENGDDEKNTDLASAIALLDDANDDHWTQAGLPDISTLKTLTGGDVMRAMVDQLPAEQKRERVKPE